MACEQRLFRLFYYLDSRNLFLNSSIHTSASVATTSFTRTLGKLLCLALREMSNTSGGIARDEQHK